jgi:Heterokaryon incompatibility protein (HET)
LIIGQRYYTTRHAHDVLLAMRSPHEVLTVWIDTICIDQANIPEKNDQVWMMGLIYSRAQQTLVWLGPAPHDSDLAMSFIALVIHAFINLADADSVTVTMLLQQTGTEQDSPPWLALGALLARPLFQRVWVVQEVALSPNVTAQCGARKLPWNDRRCDRAPPHASPLPSHNNGKQPVILKRTNIGRTHRVVHARDQKSVPHMAQ